MLVLLLLLIPLKDERPDSAQSDYKHALRLFEQGRYDIAQVEATAGWGRYRESDSAWARKFQLLNAETLLHLHQYQSVLGVLAANSSTATSKIADQIALDESVEQWTLEASALARLHQVSAANQRLDDAEHLCRTVATVSCGAVWMTRGNRALSLGQFTKARAFYLQAFHYAREHHDTWRQTYSALQLGYVALQQELFDEAVDWSSTGYQLAVQHGYEEAVETTAGNLGFAWFKLGDSERALEQFELAQKGAAKLGNREDEQAWLSTAAYAYRDTGELNRAEEMDQKSLVLARQLGLHEEVVNTLGDLSILSIFSGKLDEAEERLKEVLPMETAGGRKPRPIFVLVEGELALARQEYAKARQLFDSLLADTASPMAVRLNAGNDLGRLYEETGKDAQAERLYKSTIAAWDAARAQLKHEDSELSFGTNASQVYRNYVRFLVKHGRSAEALTWADESRARTLAAGLGVDAKHRDGHAEALNPQRIARKTGATLLFYWMDRKESYLWAVTPRKTALFTLPGESEIIAHVRRFNRAIQDLGDPVATQNPDSAFLYQSLVAPARSLVKEGTPVIILADGALSELNFETLAVPGADAASQPSLQGVKLSEQPASHYLVEDWTILEAPSLDLLAHSGVNPPGERKLLLVGNPITEDKAFPALPYFGTEMKRVASHFDSGAVREIAGAQATPSSYLNANPADYTFIHFVSHATASRTNPLESAIILSASDTPGKNEDATTYKLYAREIVRHPLKARLVTVSACNGLGTRAYTGEGLVGLSWAFLRAGARQVVAALWEASDDSTPRMMDSLYAGIASGENPAVSLRQAKLALLHTQGRFRLPYYWGAFQIYSRE